MEKYFYHLNKIKGIFSRKECFIAATLCVAFFLISSLGQMIAVIGSRQIIEPVTIEVISFSGEEIPSFKTYIQLARAGNYSLISPRAGLGDMRFVEGVFIKKLLVGIDKKDLSALSSIHITVGDKKFDVNNAAAIAEWNSFDKSFLKEELRVSQDDYDDFLLVEAPVEASLPRSKIPIYKDFFGSIMNWGGDRLIFEGPPVRALVSTGVFILFLVALRIVFWRAKERGLLGGSDEDVILFSQKRFVIFFIILLATIGIIFLIITLVYLIYKPDVAQILLKSAQEYTVYFSRQFRPKPVERLQFIFSLLSTPFILLGLYWLSKKITITDRFIRRWYWVVAGVSFLFIYATVYLGLAMSGFFYIRDSIFYENSIVKFLYILLFFPVALGWFILNKKLPKALEWFFSGLTCFVILLTFFMAVSNTNNHLSPANSPVLPSLDPVLFPVSQAVMGKNLLVNLDSYYGMYPFFIAPLFKVVDLSVLSFSVLMALLMVLSVACIFFAMRKMVQNKILLFLGFLTTIFYSLLATRVVPDYYFQYWPIRYVFPCMSLLLVASYIKNSNRFLYYFSFILYSVGILWNVDVGVIVFLSWVIVLVYREITLQNGLQRKMFNILKHVLRGIIIFSTVVGVFILFTYVQSGKFPDFSRLVQYQKIFLSGYLMIKMIPPPHMWVVVLLVYLTGILIAVRAFVEKKAGNKEEIILFLSVLGAGLFSYYEGQSTDVTLFRIAYPALILIVVFADVLWEKIKARGVGMHGESLLFVCLFYVMLAVPFNLLINGHTYLEFAKIGVSAFSAKDDAYAKNLNFIKKNTSKNEDVFILSYPNQGIYYAESQTRSAVDVTSIADIPYPEEMERLIGFIENNSDIKIFAEKPLEKYDDFDSRIKKILEEKYVEVDTSGYGMFLYKVNKKVYEKNTH